MKGDFFTSRPGFIIFMFIEKIFAFYKRARSARHGCIDALPPILQEFYLFSATKVTQNIFHQLHQLRGGGGGGSLPLSYAKSTKILFVLNVHQTRQRKKPSIVCYDTSN